MTCSVAGSFFKRRERVGRLLGMLGTSANPGLPQLVEQIASACNTTVFKKTEKIGIRSFGQRQEAL